MENITPTGVMIYFEIRKPMNRLTLEEKGTFFDAILDYAQYGIVPEFDGIMGMAWDFVSDKIDMDTDRYKQRMKQKSYAGYRSACKRKGEEPLPFLDWMEKSSLTS